jgi:deoxyribodipyrimidine photo-lyase
MRTIVWFRGKDLRLTDHQPLRQAASEGEVIPLFVLDPYFFSTEAAGQLPHRMQFLLESLRALRDNLANKGSQLVFARGPSVDVIPHLADSWRADRVVAHGWTEPVGRVRDARIAERLKQRFRLFNGETLSSPNAVLTNTGRPFSVYGAFAQAFFREIEIEPTAPAPQRLPPLPEVARAVGAWQTSEALDVPELSDLGLAHNHHLQLGGERAARRRLKDFLSQRLQGYEHQRDQLSVDGTSRLSADLKFGTLSVREVWNSVAATHQGERTAAQSKYLRELLWREFAYHCLWHRPGLLRHPFRPEFRDFPWRPGRGTEWDAWINGMTGYPVVDAAARQLLTEGFVHNRARMIAASFLTKHLLIHYKAGEAHYLKYLTDGDWASNNAGWQWSAGCGCDAQPYFRVFNPILQGAKFDPEGRYVKRYVPELSGLDPKYVHQPWRAPKDTLRRAGITLGATYPEPIVAHETARKRFLAIAETTLRRRQPHEPS